MNHDSSSKNWLERIGQLLSRPKNQEELLDVLSDAAEHHLLDSTALPMIKGVLEVYERQVRDIMIPRSQMVVIESSASLEEILPIVISSAHSRFPVIKERLDEVIGILLAKDLLRYTFSKEKTFDIQSLLWPAAFIPESKRLNILLEEFRLNRNHIAIVVDEYGGVSGMLTIEDVLEEIVGEIEDEYDIEEAQTDISPINDQQVNVKGLTLIKNFNTYFNTDFSDETFDTIGGLITHHFGYLPKRDETVTIEGLEFKVLHADKRKIRLLQVTRNG
jgi:magnesium and cobalt transporter